MEIKEVELIRIRENKFFKLYYSPDEKVVFMHFRDTTDDPWHITSFRFSRTPQVARGLYSLRERFHRKKKKSVAGLSGWEEHEALKEINK